MDEDRHLPALHKLCSDATTAAAALDTVRIEQLVAVGPAPQVLPPSWPASAPSLMVEVARAVHTDSAAREVAVSRLAETGIPALVASLWFAQGLLWRSLVPHDTKNANQNSFMSFKAATEVCVCVCGQRACLACPVPLFHAIPSCHRIVLDGIVILGQEIH